ncbi:unnamed protein product [Urochloa decumbens]|uniref:F-box domain-containing protein n=1 Tax=Urochloa decumbens TaxID=240449 RepID=A0ABC8YCI4_9POAL
MERPLESESRSREIPTEILHDILVRLPAKDVARSSCVTKLWRAIVRDPSFRKLHGAHHVAAPSESELLLVSIEREPGRPDEVSVSNLSPGKAMCNVAIPSGYSLGNICNGFLCFTLHGHDQAPVVVCNPVTGEMLELPKAPPVSVSDKDNQLHSRGSSRGWRRYSYLSRFCPLHTLPPPLHIDGNLYVPVETGHRYNPPENGYAYIPGLEGPVVPSGRAARMLVLNVATEKRRSYRLPYNYDEGYHPAWKEMLADGFEMNGQMCLAVKVMYPRPKLQFWVMLPPGELEDDKNDDKLHWDLRYCFDMGDEQHLYAIRLSAAWLDHDEMLCYRHGEFLYKHDTRGHSLSSNAAPLLFDERHDLTEALLPYQWNIYGGYRPTLLSPLTFALPSSHDEKGKKRQLEHTLLRAITQSKRRNNGPRVGHQHL